ncbi:hypothetical protein ACFLSE_07565 [Bacteroidota bacterium]
MWFTPHTFYFISLRKKSLSADLTSGGSQVDVPFEDILRKEFFFFRTALKNQ